MVTLIANSGVQFYTTKINLGDNNPAFQTRLVMYEKKDEKMALDPDTNKLKGTGRYDITLDFAYRYKADKNSQPIYIEYEPLMGTEAYDSIADKVIDDKIRPDQIIVVSPNTIVTSNIADSLDVMEDLWLPIPYYKKQKNNRKGTSVVTGPETWARMFLTRIPREEIGNNKENYTHYLTLAFDTNIGNDALLVKDPVNSSKNIYLSPLQSDVDNRETFVIPNEKVALSFCNRKWVEDWIKTDWNKKQNRNINNRQTNKWTFPFAVDYINLFKLLRETAQDDNLFQHVVFPEIKLCNNSEDTPVVEIDLVLDIGNSRTCGLLVPTIYKNQANGGFGFENIAPLAIRDLTYPNRLYTEPFEMSVTFGRTGFGRDTSYFDVFMNETGGVKVFDWPSLVRVGAEATRLAVTSAEKSAYSTMSSPKRYLWDTNIKKESWTFVNSNLPTTETTAALYGIASQFTEEGELVREKKVQQIKNANLRNIDTKTLPPVFSTTSALFPRSSMMTFVLAEIFLHAINYINSHEYRNKTGHITNIETPRKLKRIVITCPTAMLPTEAIKLRKHAESAIKALSFYFGNKNFIDINLSDGVIPYPLKLENNIKGEEDGDSKHWNFDEATCSQLVFLYGSIHNHYQGNPNTFFDTVGKPREDAIFSNGNELKKEQIILQKQYPSGGYTYEQEMQRLQDKYKNKPSGKNAVCIASIDIGGGTTDLMICSYQNDPGATVTSLKPQPQFWEGFNLAGDDILKSIIDRIILPSITEHAISLGYSNENTQWARRICFGEYSTNMNAKDKWMRGLIAKQIFKPIATGIIKYISDKETHDLVEKEVDFWYFFAPPQQSPSGDVIQYIDDTFEKYGIIGFQMKKVKFNLIAKRINQIIIDVMGKTLKELCYLIAKHKCDYTILSGKAGSFPIIREIILRHLPVMPDRVIQLENYKIGTWYPFNTADGRILDSKTCVSVGATICLMAGYHNLLGEFRIDTQFLAREIKSTAQYIYEFDRNRLKERVNIAGNSNQNKESTYLFQTSPMLIGMKQLALDDWTASPIYVLKYKNASVGSRIANALPLIVKLDKELSDDGTFVSFLGILSAKPLNRNGNLEDDYADELEILLQTMIDENGYWLDRGEFKIDYANGTQENI